MLLNAGDTQGTSSPNATQQVVWETPTLDSGSEIVDSLLFSSVSVHSYGRIEGAILLPDVEVGRYSRIRRAVIDTGCRIPPGTIIGKDSVADSERFRVTEKGIVLVTAKMLGQESAAKPRLSVRETQPRFLHLSK